MRQKNTEKTFNVGGTYEISLQLLQSLNIIITHYNLTTQIKVFFIVSKPSLLYCQIRNIMKNRLLLKLKFKIKSILLHFILQGVSWSTVRYMLSEVQYGGRVTDDFDKRLLKTFCRVWFHENMFLDSFKFYQGYTIPKCNALSDFKSHIMNLPSVDSPEVSYHYFIELSLKYLVGGGVTDTHIESIVLS